MHATPPNPPSRENVQRVVLLSHDPATERISLRHYSIHTAPSGVTKGVKSVVAGTALPALAQLGDVSELLLKSGYGSVRTSSAPSAMSRLRGCCAEKPEQQHAHGGCPVRPGLPGQWSEMLLKSDCGSVPSEPPKAQATVGCLIVLLVMPAGIQGGTGAHQLGSLLQWALWQ